MEFKTGRRSLPKTLVAPLIIIVFGASLLASCIPPPSTPFTTGIRVETYLDLGTRLGPEPVPGVSNSGQLTSTAGPPGPGPQTRIGFTGVTNSNAYSDYPDCRTNAYWNFTVNYFGVIPGCGTATQTYYIQPDGNIIKWVCYG